MTIDGVVEMTNQSKGGAEYDVHDVPTKSKEESTNYYGSTGLLDRYISFIPTVAFGTTLQASWEASAIGFAAGLYNGGPTSLVWGTLIAWIGSAAIVASLSEMASINPTVGAQYRWTAMFAPRSVISPAFWSLLQGWITIFAWMAGTAQPSFINGTLIQGLIILNNDSYVPQRWHGTLISWLCLAVPVACNIWGRKLLPSIEIVMGVTHIVFFVATVTTLVILGPRSDASFVFGTTFTGYSGWTNPGVQWCIGLLSSAFPLVAFDGLLHMSDEIKDAPNKVPKSMLYSITINGALSFGFIITLLFTMGDPATILATKTGFPFIEICYQATQSKIGASVLVVMNIFQGTGSLFGSLASVSRLTWAFARDHGLPYAEYFGYVHPRLRIPLNSLWLVSAICVALSLINIGSTTAFYALLSLGTLALYISYIMPILFIALRKVSGEPIQYGPFRLGRFGLPINIFALVYGIFISIWLPFPPFQPVTAANMNYGGPIVAVVIIFAISDWFLGGKTRFQVPVARHTMHG